MVLGTYKTLINYHPIIININSLYLNKINLTWAFNNIIVPKLSVPKINESKK